MVKDPQHQNDPSDDAVHSTPHIQGEESISGSESAPESDDDTLAAAQAVGTQLDEDEHHPQDIDIGRDITKAEEYHRTH